MSEPALFKVMYGRNYAHAMPDWPDRVVMCHGVFDLLHLGHIRHLQQAKSWGNKLIVSVTSDEHVAKGLGRPHFTAEQRVEALIALDCVDDAFVNPDPDPIEAIRRIQPDIYVKGADYSGELIESPVCRELGIEVRFTDTEKWSSSRLISAEKFGPKTAKYLELARERGFLAEILAAFERADAMNIAFVGEKIIDEYIYVTGLGKSSKEYTLVTQLANKDTFDGGVIAAAKQGEWKNVAIVTADTEIIKTRYVDRDFSRKLFEIYSDNNLNLSYSARQKLNKELANALKADCVIVFDFGHGLITHGERIFLIDSKFLAVNAQTNAGNHGFNRVTLYPRADFVCVDEPEARLAVGDPRMPIADVVSWLREQIVCNRILVTRGRNGSIWTEDKRRGHAPVLSTSALDTMGAGDAVLAVTAPLLAAGLDLEAAALVGNVVGAIKVGILGHSRHVERQDIVRTLESLLK